MNLDRFRQTNLADECGWQLGIFASACCLIKLIDEQAICGSVTTWLDISPSIFCTIFPMCKGPAEIWRDWEMNDNFDLSFFRVQNQNEVVIKQPVTSKVLIHPDITIISSHVV